MIDNNSFASSSADLNVYTWDLRSNKHTHSYKLKGNSRNINIENQSIFSADESGLLTIFSES